MKTEMQLSPFFDAHVHLRGPEAPWCPEAFRLIVEATARQCCYAVVMPNSPMVKTVDEMINYREQILAISGEKYPWFTPLMTLYLTENSSLDDVKRASELSWFAGWKLYPQGVTTGSEDGVSDYRKLEKILREIEATGQRLLIHGESTDPLVDPLYAEEKFVAEDLPIVRQMFSGKICLEHCSTKAAVDAVLADSNMWGSITPHHLTGINSETGDPHNRCKPVWQTERNRNYVRGAAFGPNNDGKFFAGTDSAPQLMSAKYNFFVPNGCFSAPVALAIYLEAFDDAIFNYDHSPGGMIEHLNDKFTERVENFLYSNAAKFYGRPGRESVRQSPGIVASDVPSMASSSDEFRFFDPLRLTRDRIVPLRSGEKLRFSVDFR